MTAKEQREARLAAQLRANLRRRKAAPVADVQSSADEDKDGAFGEDNSPATT